MISDVIIFATGAALASLFWVRRSVEQRRGFNAAVQEVKQIRARASAVLPAVVNLRERALGLRRTLNSDRSDRAQALAASVRH